MYWFAISGFFIFAFSQFFTWNNIDWFGLGRKETGALVGVVISLLSGVILYDKNKQAIKDYFSS